jgi:hypothetical protein
VYQHAATPHVLVAATTRKVQWPVPLLADFFRRGRNHALRRQETAVFPPCRKLARGKELRHGARRFCAPAKSACARPRAQAAKRNLAVDKRLRSSPAYMVSQNLTTYVNTL